MIQRKVGEVEGGKRMGNLGKGKVSARRPPATLMENSHGGAANWGAEKVCVQSVWTKSKRWNGKWKNCVGPERGASKKQASNRKPYEMTFGGLIRVVLTLDMAFVLMSRMDC